MKFIKVLEWSWKRFFLGDMIIHTTTDVTEKQVRDWIEKSTTNGGNGNYQKDSLVKKEVKVKEKSVVLTKI